MRLSRSSRPLRLLAGSPPRVSLPALLPFLLALVFASALLPRQRLFVLLGASRGRQLEASSVVGSRCRCRCRAASGDATFLQRKDQLKRCLAREYRSFFSPFEAEYYSEDVTFKDPLNELAGKESYRKNVEMLSGKSLIGNVLFAGGYIDLHAVEEVPGDERKLRTRWTLGFTFQLVPWRPHALFTGVSEYTIDADAKVLGQRDYWDTLSLGDSGSYKPEDGLAGLADLGAQLLPGFLRPPEADEPPAAVAGDWVLLRRAAAYRIYRSRASVIFAVPTPGAATGSEALAATLRGHGLTPGGTLSVDGKSGSVSSGKQIGLELLSPHPWDGEPPLE